MRVSFDFDDTLGKISITPIFGWVNTPIQSTIFTLLRHAKAGDEIYVVTARPDAIEQEFNAKSPQEYCIAWDIDKYIKFYGRTHGALKGPLLQKLGVAMHYDDDLAELDNVRKHGIIPRRITAANDMHGGRE